VEQDIREAVAPPGMDSAPKLSALQRLHVNPHYSTCVSESLEIEKMDAR